MLRLILALVLTGLVSGVAAAETVQIQLRGSVPEGLRAELLLLDSASAGCQDAPCRVSAKKVKIPRHAKGGGVMNVEISAPVTRICLQALRTHRITSATLFFRGDRAPVEMKRGKTIARDGTSACTPKSVRISDGKIWRVVIAK